MPRRKGRRTFGSSRQLPSGRWQARYPIPSGQRITAPKTFATKADVDRYLAMVEADMSRGAWIDPRLSKTTFAVWVERWWELAQPTLRPKTQLTYQWVLDGYLLPVFGAQPLAAIDTLAVRAWIAKLRSSGAGDATIAKAYRLLRRILNAAVEVGYLLRNPCTVKGAGRESTPDLHVPTVAEVAKLANVIDERYRVLVLVATYGALRWGELVALRRHRVDLKNATIQVVEQVTEINGELQVGVPKTAAGHRKVRLPRFVADELATHLQQFAERGRTGLVFPAPKGGYLRSSNFHRNIWKPACTRAGLDGVRLHDLRHAGATFAAQAGATTKELMVRIGHASSAAALRYQHAQAERDRMIAEGLERLGGKPKGTQRARTPRVKRTGDADKRQKDTR